MNTLGTMGGLLPLWIIGAPFLAGLYALFTTPKPATRSDRNDRMDRPYVAPGQGAGVMPARA